ncbi:hypothetical protein AMATHDRAFT_63524 [Amanita thiersii Skay4041]|uniref:Uncharacterized protein n=1 Tax=Amanita thiersii Skay4041 TaxID=703135 RepID=A0A2A9NLQ4_9AGAR|nr:hypothetical protein AMATHDRAFT_63524 [Amanita thiersii Skay4041]
MHPGAYNNPSPPPPSYYDGYGATSNEAHLPQYFATPTPAYRCNGHERVTIRLIGPSYHTVQQASRPCWVIPGTYSRADTAAKDRFWAALFIAFMIWFWLALFTEAFELLGILLLAVKAALERFVDEVLRHVGIGGPGRI